MKDVTEVRATLQRFLTEPIATALAHLLSLRPNPERIDSRNESRQAWIHAAVWRLQVCRSCASGPAKRIANRHAICRRPIAAKLEEILHVVDIDLWPNKDVPFNVHVHPDAQMGLEMT
jgi:hypothetical protein